jgi:hypothetical protein
MAQTARQFCQIWHGQEPVNHFHRPPVNHKHRLYLINYGVLKTKLVKERPKALTAMTQAQTSTDILNMTTYSHNIPMVDFVSIHLELQSFLSQKCNIKLVGICDANIK